MNNSWRKSTRSASQECVEVATEPTVVQVRDSKNPDGGILSFSVDDWREFVVFARDIG